MTTNLEIAVLLDRYLVGPTLEGTRYDSPEARVMLIVIALHESGGYKLLQEVGRNRTPTVEYAHGLWQFERAGVRALSEHEAALRCLHELDRKAWAAVQQDPEETWNSIVFDSRTACSLARALLWTVPKPLPALSDGDEAWEQYVWAWRPGAAEEPRYVRYHEARARFGRIWKELVG